MKIQTSKVAEKLKQQGFKLTKPRLEVIKFILARKGHITAEQAYKKLIYKNLGRSTIFRTFKILSQLGLLEKKPQNCIKNYELKERPLHFHITCAKCQKVLEFTSSKIEKICRNHIKAKNFHMRGIYLEIFGICKKCKEKK